MSANSEFHSLAERDPDLLCAFIEAARLADDILRGNHGGWDQALAAFRDHARAAIAKATKPATPMTRAERDALAEIATWNAPHYLWRQASMRKLEARGLVRKTGKLWGKVIEYAITPEGIEAAKGMAV